MFVPPQPTQQPPYIQQQQHAPIIQQPQIIMQAPAPAPAPLIIPIILNTNDNNQPQVGRAMQAPNSSAANG